MREIRVPTINSNDDRCVLRERLVESGARVRADDLIAVLETSKATCDLDAGAAGVLEWEAASGTECRFGSIVARVFDSDQERSEHLARAASARPPVAAVTVTKAARELMRKAGLDESALAGLGRPLVRSEDIEALLDRAPVSSRRRERIAATVSLSHATIPKAFLLVRVWCDDALRRLAEVGAASGVPVGLPELLVQAVGGLGPEFAAFRGAAAATRPDAVDVGVTLDAGRGLFVPVVRDAGRRSLPEIAETLLEFRLKALRDEFVEADLEGGQISISLNMDEDVVCAVPLVLPGQTCMLSLGGLLSEARPTDDGGVAARRCVHLGVAYDHRAVSGDDALRLARWLKARFEEPRSAGA